MLKVGLAAVIFICDGKRVWRSIWSCMFEPKYDDDGDGDGGGGDDELSKISRPPPAAIFGFGFRGIAWSFVKNLRG